MNSKSIRAAEPRRGGISRAARRRLASRWIAEALETRRLLAAGQLDPSFDGDGYRISEIAAPQVLVDPAGRTLLVGVSPKVPILAASIVRLDASGSPDPTFDGDGIATISSIEMPDFALSLPDGQTLVFGLQPESKGGKSVVVRLTASGAVDTTFGSQGIGLTGLGYHGTVKDAAIDFAGRLLIAGIHRDNTGGDPTVAIARLTAAGRADLQFDRDGVYERVESIGNAFPTSAPVDADALRLVPQYGGNVLLSAAISPWLANSYQQYFFRLTEYGVPDTQLASTGVLKFDPTPGDDLARDVEPLPDGSFIAVGRRGGTPAAWKMDSTLKLDAWFGSGGVVYSPLGSTGDATPTAAAADRNGHLIIAGGSSTQREIRVGRLNSDTGAVDSSFKFSSLRTDLQAFQVRSVAARPTGEVALGTLEYKLPTSVYGIYRLQGDGAAPTLPTPRFTHSDTFEEYGGTLSGWVTLGSPDRPIYKWEWDFDYDGTTFTTDVSRLNAPGGQPNYANYPTAGLDGPSMMQVAVRVTDVGGLVGMAVQPLPILNLSPSATFAATASGNTITAAFSNATDISPADRAAGFRYSFDFNYDGDFNDPGDVYRSTSPTASYAYATSGTYKVGGRVEDKDGGYTDYSAFATVTANPNLAAGKPTTASATAAGSSPANATDLDLASEWVATTSGDAFLVVDLGNFFKVSSIVASFGAGGIPSSFAIQTSTDGVIYSSVASYSGNTSASKTVSGPTTAVRYVRLNFYGGAAPYRVSDLRVYGSVTLPPRPGVDIDGPLPVYEGSPATFTAVTTVAAGQSIAKYEWDLSYDAVDGFRPEFTSTTSPSVTIPASDLDGPAPITVAVRVTDNVGQTVTWQWASAVQNVAPTATLGVVANADGSATATFSGATDPGVADRAAGFRYSFDFNNDGDFADAGEVSNATSPIATYAFAASGTYTIRGRISDKDGGFTDYTKSVSVTVPTSTTPARLTGTGIGTPGSFNNGGNTFAKALDDNLASFFDAPSGNGNWVGLDLGSAKSISQVGYAPRGGWAGRMVGGVFQGSNDASFAGAATLATISTKPAEGTIATLGVTNATAFRYVRYLSPAGSYGNVAEVQFFTGGGTPTTPPPTPPPPTSSGELTGALIGTSGSFANGGNTIAKAVDGNLASFFDGPSGDNQWVGLDLGSAAGRVTSVSFAPRGGWEGRMVGGVFQGSNDATFATGVATLATITAKPTAGTLTSLTVTGASAYRYVRYLAPKGSYGNVAELKFFGSTGGTTTPPPTTATLLTGSYIGTAGSFAGSGNVGAKLFDGSVSSFFDAPTSSGAWAGLDLGTARTITSISYAPRGGWAGRMVGGMFQASNDATFATGVVTLATITAKPTEGVLTSVAVTAGGSYRYVRYLGPAGGYGNASEVQFFG